jgi:hypothetical protein
VNPADESRVSLGIVEEVFMQYRAWVSGLHTNCELFWPGLSGWPRVQVEAVGLGQHCAEKGKQGSAEVPCLLFSALPC